MNDAQLMTALIYCGFRDEELCSICPYYGPVNVGELACYKRMHIDVKNRISDLVDKNCELESLVGRLEKELELRKAVKL